MILYHVSPDIDDIKEIFIPRVPSSAADDEDKTTPRFCVSTTIAGAYAGMPKDDRTIDGNCNLRVYVFDTEDYEIIPYEELYEKGLVIDAIYTKEHWILSNMIRPIDSYVIKLEKYDYEIMPLCKLEYLKEYIRISKDDPDGVDELLINEWNGRPKAVINKVEYSYKDGTIYTSKNNLYEYYNNLDVWNEK